MPARLKSSMSLAHPDAPAPYPPLQANRQPAGSAGEFGFVLTLSLGGLALSLLLMMQSFAAADDGLADILRLLT